MNKVEDNRERVSASALDMQMLSFTPALKVERDEMEILSCWFTVGRMQGAQITLDLY